MPENTDFNDKNDEYAAAYDEFLIETAASGVKAATVASPSIVYASTMGAKMIGKRIPIIGAIVTAGFSLQETFDHAIQGNFCKAGGAAVSGFFETGGNLVFPLGGGDAAHYSIREAWVAIAGDRCAPNETDIVAAYKFVRDEMTDTPTTSPATEPVAVAGTTGPGTEKDERFLSMLITERPITPA